MKFPLLSASALALAALAFGQNALAHGNHEEEKVTPLQIRKLPDIPGKQAIVAIVDFAPGQAAQPHAHPGSLFAYVLEGELVSQLEGQAPVTYRKGQTWYEPPHVDHVVARNPSRTRPARLLVHVLVDEGGQVKQPLEQR
ncbi:cupin domain-containing protein [Variovorax sp. JS1663]|uniref:cupin domain-containing protein n=1 Tax=Variovorax sp. JS1663 TaxID=1851577 RepID=UPI000B3488DD|nr:cupin domain-containing protein [Variovorax sp. JS1663]OUM00299.1 hypothetical protein A8M77_21695 [Variovorax sp. JS1663]